MSRHHLYGLTFLNEQGLFRGVATQFENHVANLSHNPLSRRLVQKTVAFLREHEKKLRPGKQLPMSTEILESSFSLYKQLEKQHSKSGFTSLLLTFPTLLRPTTPKEILRGIPARQDSRRKEMGTRPSANHTRFKTPARLSRTSAHNQSKNRKGATSEL